MNMIMKNDLLVQYVVMEINTIIKFVLLAIP